MATEPGLTLNGGKPVAPGTSLRVGLKSTLPTKFTSALPGIVSEEVTD